METVNTGSVTISVAESGTKRFRLCADCDTSAEFVELRVRKFSVSVKDFVTDAVTVSVNVVVTGAVRVMWRMFGMCRLRKKHLILHKGSFTSS